MIYSLKLAKNESNFESDFEHPTLQGALLTAFIPRALPWAKSFCPFRACCLYGLQPLQGVPSVQVEYFYFFSFRFYSFQK